LRIDLDDLIRWLKPDKRLRPLSRRDDGQLPWIETEPLIGSPIFLDTTVYFDVLRSRSTEALECFIDTRLCNHSAVCIAELSAPFGRLNPADPRTASALAQIGKTIGNVPPHRLYAPDTETWGAAAILSGLLARLGSLPAVSERKHLNDALVFLQARKHGCPVLTANYKDFDYLNQLVPDGRILLYRRAN
jgi:predicted nucleic acid-binding protein